MAVAAPAMATDPVLIRNAVEAATQALGGQAASKSATSSNGKNTVNGSCLGRASVSTGGFQSPMTWVVSAEADANSSTIGVAALATGVVCVVKDRDTGWEYGRVTGGLPGSTAVAVGKVSVPAGRVATVCTQANATFTDGYPAVTPDC